MNETKQAMEANPVSIALGKISATYNSLPNPFPTIILPGILFFGWLIYFYGFDYQAAAMLSVVSTGCIQAVKLVLG
jgi:hypothetical protein